MSKKDILENKSLHSQFFDLVNQGTLLEVNTYIMRGLNINYKNKKGNTALHIAIIRGYYKIADMLIEAGINLNIKNNENKTALNLAVKLKKVCEFDLLCKHSWIANLEDIEKLIQIGEENNPKSIIDNVTKHITDKTQKEKDEILLQAIKGNKPLSSKYLLKAGAKISIQDMQDIFKSSSSDSDKLALTEMIRETADYWPNNFKAAMLSYAIEKDLHLIVSAFLIDNPENSYCAFEKVCNYAVKNNYTNLYLDLVTCIKKVPLYKKQDFLQTSINQGSSSFMNLLIEKFFGEIKVAPNNIFIHLAIECQNQEAISMLIKNNVDLELKNEKGETPIMAAAKSGNKEIITMIQDARAARREQPELQDSLEQRELNKIIEVLQKIEQEEEKLYLKLLEQRKKGPLFHRRKKNNDTLKRKRENESEYLPKQENKRLRISNLEKEDCSEKQSNSFRHSIYKVSEVGSELSR